MTKTKTKITIKDRNLIAYLLANGHVCEFIRRPSASEIDAEFVRNRTLDHACMDYAGNREVPVQSFVAACRQVGSIIRQHRIEKKEGSNG